MSQVQAYQVPTLPAAELAYLRELARKMKAVAELPVMAARRAQWTAMNDAVPGTPPPFVIETWTWDRDFMPESLFRCTTKAGRALERTFLRHLRHHELLDDDHVCPDTLDMGWHVWHHEFGIDIPTHYLKDAEGVVTGYHFDCPIKDLERDGFAMVKPAEFGVDREGTMAEKAWLEECFGDILPVVIRSGVFGNCNLTQRLVRLMSQDVMFMAIHDCPDRLRGVLQLLHDNAQRMCRWAEREGLLVLNHQNQCTCGSCFNFTTLLPRRPVVPGQVKLSDMWTAMDSQETVGVSPQAFHEIFYPFYADLAAMFGLVYWGCCEPADPLWERSLSKLPNLKAVSISRWANQAYMADALAGTGIVFSRKPNPNLLGVTRELDEDAWVRELRTTLELTSKRPLPTELIVRDVYSMHGNLAKPRRAVELARQEIARYY